MAPETYDVFLFNPVNGLAHKCKGCNKILAAGDFGIGVRIYGSYYLACLSTPASCCKKQEKIWAIFSYRFQAYNCIEDLEYHLGNVEDLETLSLYYYPLLKTWKAHQF